MVTTSFDAASRASTLTGTLNSTPTTYISSSQYWPTGAPWYFVRGSNNNIWSVASYNSRLQLQESYEAISDGRDTPTSTNYYPKLMLFVSCPNWGVQTNSDWGAWIICPAENQTNDNGTLQGYQEFLGGPTFSALQNIQQTFTYDGLNRLKTAQEATSSWNRTYTYDRWGNMTPSTSNSVIPLAANSPTGFNSATNRFSTPGIFSFDNGGNLTALKGNTLAYDAEKRLKSVNGLGISETISYDATGRRVHKSLSSGSTAYVYDAFGNLSAEYANGTTWSRDYIRWAGGQLIATENATGPCTTCYFSYDHLGSVRMLTDANANIIARHDYLPYGEEIAAGVGGRNSQFGLTTDTTAKFTGQLRDQEAGQDYFNARYFAAPLGRFNSPDPSSAGANLSSPQSWNGYAYVMGNPLASTDSTGMDDGNCSVQTSIDQITTDQTSDGGSAGASATVSINCPEELPTAGQPPNFQLNTTDPSSINGTVGSTAIGSDGMPDPATYDEPLPEWGQSLIIVGKYVPAQYQLLTGLAGGSAALGAGIALAPAAATGAANVAARGIGWAQGAWGAGTGVVLGSYNQVNNYIEAAQSMRANYFSVPTPVWNVLSYFGQSWTANRAFLDASVARGQQFWLATNPLEATNYFAMELQYLNSIGVGPSAWETVWLPLQ